MIEFALLYALVAIPYLIILGVVGYGAFLFFLKKFLGPHN
jgi:hypothetical protein